MDTSESLSQTKSVQKRIKHLQKRMRKNTEYESSTSQMWRRFKRNKAGVVALFIIVFFTLLAIIAAPISFSVGYRGINLTYNWSGLLTFNPNPLIQQQYVTGAAPPGEYTYVPVGSSSGKTQTAYSIFGTTLTGADLYSRLMIGMRTMLLISFGATIISVIIGSIVGMAAGYYGGILDELLMRFTDIVLSIPFYFIILLAIIQISDLPMLFVPLDAIKYSNDSVFIAEVIGLGLFGWMVFARLVRAEIFRVKNLEYIESAVALGVNPQRILLRHIVPNILAPLIIFSAIGMGANIAAVAAIDFVLAINNPVSGVPSWGSDLALGINSWLGHTAWWQIVFPGALIVITILAFNLIGNSLREVFDPRLR